MNENLQKKINEAFSSLKGTARQNKIAVLCLTIYNVVLLACYLVEVIKGSRTIGYYAVFTVLALIPLVLGIVSNRLNIEDETLKFKLVITYAVFYGFTIFTTTSPVAFVYGALIAMIILVYSDIRISTIVGAGFFVLNLIQVVFMGANGQITDAEMPNVEIRLGFMLLYAVFMVMITKTTSEINRIKMDHIEKEKENVAAMLDQIMNISRTMTADILTVADKMDLLESSVSRTKVSMEEVSNGTNDTAESVQSQLIKTEEIQNFIHKVEEVSGNIESDMESANDEISMGKEKIDELIAQVQISDEASVKVAEELGRLTEYAGQMQSIIQMIDEITSQTSLLSLNASIEAARVGEAGKGFAVVASEISNLAEQTQSATVNITELIENITNELDEVVKVINYMMDNNKLQSVAATETASSFETIASKTEGIHQQTEELSGLVGELANSNESIVDSIQTISAATEEVTAHSSETLECSEENTSIVNEVGEIVAKLQSLAGSLSTVEHN